MISHDIKKNISYVLSQILEYSFSRTHIFMDFRRAH